MTMSLIAKDNPAPTISERHVRRSALALFLERYGILLVFMALFIAASVASPHFLSAGNLLNVARQVAIIGVLSVGMTFVILTGGIDLSAGSVLAVAALCAAALKSYPSVVVLVAVLLLGAACGLVNGTIVTRGRVQPFITTLGTMTILIGLGLTASGGEPILGAPKSLVFLGRGQFAGVPVQAILFAIVAALAGLLLKITRFGRHVYAVGGNEEASRLSGVSVDRVKVMVYMIAGVLAALGGLIMAEHLNVGEANLGKGLELDAIAAVVVGGTSLSGGRGGVGGTVIGVLLIGVLNNLLNLLDVPAYTQLVLKGCIIISAVLIQERVSRKA